MDNMPVGWLLNGGRVLFGKMWTSDEVARVRMGVLDRAANEADLFGKMGRFVRTPENTGIHAHV